MPSNADCMPSNADCPHGTADCPPCKRGCTSSTACLPPSNADCMPSNIDCPLCKRGCTSSTACLSPSNADCMSTTAAHSQELLITRRLMRMFKVSKAMMMEFHVCRELSRSSLERRRICHNSPSSVFIGIDITTVLCAAMARLRAAAASLMRSDVSPVAPSTGTHPTMQPSVLAGQADSQATLGIAGMKRNTARSQEMLITRRLMRMFKASKAMLSEFHVCRACTLLITA